MIRKYDMPRLGDCIGNTETYLLFADSQLVQRHSSACKLPGCVMGEGKPTEIICRHRDFSEAMLNMVSVKHETRLHAQASPHLSTSNNQTQDPKKRAGSSKTW
jgi:hypothetical protein